MRWRKLGRVYVPDGNEPWARSHAMIPTPVAMPDGGLRIYFASCDDKGIGRIGYADLDPRDPTRILRRAAKPVLDIGRPGCFDDNGVNPTCAIWRGGELWLYYVGYQLGVQVRYTLFSGLAISRDGGESFTRVSEAPILERCDGELLYRTAPFVLPENDGWRMLYIAGDHEVEVGRQSRAELSHARSPVSRWPALDRAEPFRARGRLKLLNTVSAGPSWCRRGRDTNSIFRRARCDTATGSPMPHRRTAATGSAMTRRSASMSHPRAGTPNLSVSAP
jgi:hypothetical protein